MNTLLEKICIPIIAHTLDDFLRSLEKAQTVANYIELRVDYLSSLSESTLNIIANHTYKKTIFCCRAQQEGGRFTGTKVEQTALLQQANDLGFDYLDIDLTCINNIKFPKKNAKIIISYHNWSKTPSLVELKKLKLQMNLHHPDVIKFATQVHNDRDAKRLMQFLVSNSYAQPIIVLGMGDAGKTQRFLAPLLGGYLTFAALENKISAPGQLDAAKLKSLYQTLEQF